MPLASLVGVAAASGKACTQAGGTHGVADCIHFSIYGMEGGQLCRAAGKAPVQLIICGHLIVSPLQILLILHNGTDKSGLAPEVYQKLANTMQRQSCTCALDAACLHQLAPELVNIK